MTKAELVEKVSRHYEVQEPDSKLFFETFLRKVHELVDSEKAVTFDGLAEVQITKAVSGSDTIAFSLDSGEKLFFDVPRERKSHLNSLDSYYSLSFGKPVVPMQGTEETEFFISDSMDETGKIIELKVERIIEKAKENNFDQAFNAEDLSDEEIDFSFLNWKSVSVDSETGTEPEVTGEKDVKSEISLPDIKDPNVIPDKTPEAPEKINQTGTSEIIGKKEDLSGVKINEENTVKNETLPVESEFVEVEPVHKSADTKTDKELNEVHAEELEIKEEKSLYKIDDESFVEIDEPEEKIPEAVKSKTPDTVKPGKIQETLPDRIEETNTGDDKAIKEAFSYAAEKWTRLEGYSKRKSRIGLFFSILILAAAAAAGYFSFFLPLKKNTDNTQLNRVTVEETQNFASVIERDYEYPVTYPYQGGMFSGFYNAFKLSGEIPSLVPGTEIPEIREPVPSVRVKGYIYKYDDMYAVQLSSWKSKSIAESETKKYLNAGYNAFIERTSITAGIYYRVRIGGFNSLEEAEAFLNKK
jgi:hypothetical protein